MFGTGRLLAGLTVAALVLPGFAAAEEGNAGDQAPPASDGAAQVDEEVYPELPVMEWYAQGVELEDFRGQYLIVAFYSDDHG